jgi:hypothetical protein
MSVRSRQISYNIEDLLPGRTFDLGKIGVNPILPQLLFILIIEKSASRWKRRPWDPGKNQVLGQEVLLVDFFLPGKGGMGKNGEPLAEGLA